MKRRNLLRRLSLGKLIFLLCGFHLLLVFPAVFCDFRPGDDLPEIMFAIGAFNATILTSVWIGLGGRISPWRLVVLVLLGLPMVWLGSKSSSKFLNEVPVVLFFMMVTISSVFLTIRFFGCQLRRVCHAKQLLARGEQRCRQSKEKQSVVAKPVIQFTLRGMLSWTAAFALVLGSLTTLWPIFKEVTDVDMQIAYMLCWFAFFSLAALWLACGIRFLPIRIIVFTVGVLIGCIQAGHEGGGVVVVCLWIWGVFLLVRAGGFRFLRVAPNPIYEEPPRSCDSARE